MVKRKTPPGITAEALKEVAPNLRVMITHNHYDHLDRSSIKGLPENTKMFVPMGLKQYVQKMNKRDVTEMDNHTHDQRTACDRERKAKT